ncbi:unnamed protein product [Amoebophrya sp. A120]|nr:unnamed protein product [Amoebophrya sp. A120]|eukprot:GSA120T00013414001.1
MATVAVGQPRKPSSRGSSRGSARPSIHFNRPPTDELVIVGAGVRELNGLYSRQEAISIPFPRYDPKTKQRLPAIINVPNGFRKICKRENFGTPEDFWIAVNQHADYYQHEKSDAYIYFDCERETWFLDDAKGTSVYEFDMKKNFESIAQGALEMGFQVPQQLFAKLGSAVPLTSLNAKPGWEMTKANRRMRELNPFRRGEMDVPIVKISENYPIELLPELGDEDGEEDSKDAVLVAAGGENSGDMKFDRGEGV